MPRRYPMPTLGLSSKKKSPLPKVFALAVVAGLIAGAVYWVRRIPEGKTLPPAIAKMREALAVGIDAGSAQPLNTDSAAVPSGAPSAPAAPAKPVPNPVRQSGIRLASVVVNGPLETAIVDATGSVTGPALTQVLKRALVWWANVPGDLLKGDRIDVLYEERANEEPLMHAVRFISSKLGRTFQAYRFKGPQDAYARFYQPNGDELELRLEDSPIDEYEQITSLLRDGRRHKGVDFKAREGTPVHATFDGVITRRNWNFRGNGNSLELTDATGRRKALFLHLSELSSNVRVGLRVHKGDVIAHSGNSGHSFAPHLHYQLMAGDAKVLDPFNVHRTYRRRLSDDVRPAFEAEMRRLEPLLSPQHASAERGR
jgi:murein DD-endopeptidase